MSAFAVGAYSTAPVSRPVVCALGLTQKQACPCFRPRPSALRLCRQAKLHTVTCKASAAAQPLHLAHPSPVHRVAATVLSFWQHSLRQLASLLQIKPDQPEQQQASSKDINAQIKASIKNMRCLAAVAPFAAASGSTNTFILITKAVGSFIKLYLLLLFLRVLLSWFPAFGWDKQPWLALRQVTDPYLNLFRGLVPPLLGTIDFTPLFGFLILQFLAGTLDLGAEDEW